ncbi:uncharacterized protein CIMG_12751 [Coccidioides immitis RS]|uniref:Uncharacterized protein n=1 Tax=Coccidioides immitis (strain RS) TaxID=246410 RepID=A0A0D8JS62_COCIM|nr:uncharacterized protein CIMG_12751 [Coccidioides immitis RS]KJF60107.1 hypothetical protein CIMG_12751 [Coccidioides immitis RS]
MNARGDHSSAMQPISITSGYRRSSGSFVGTTLYCSAEHKMNGGQEGRFSTCRHAGNRKACGKGEKRGKAGNWWKLTFFHSSHSEARSSSASSSSFLCSILF